MYKVPVQLDLLQPVVEGDGLLAGDAAGASLERLHAHPLAERFATVDERAELRELASLVKAAPSRLPAGDAQQPLYGFIEPHPIWASLVPVKEEKPLGILDAFRLLPLVAVLREKNGGPRILGETTVREVARLARPYTKNLSVNNIYR